MPTKISFYFGKSKSAHQISRPITSGPAASRKMIRLPKAGTANRKEKKRTFAQKLQVRCCILKINPYICTTKTEAIPILVSEIP